MTNAPPRKRRGFPVSSFGPQLMAVWLRAVKEEVRLEFPNVKTAKQFQLRLQMLRGAMTREDHEHKDLVQRARTSLRTGIRAGEEHVNDPNGEKYALLVVYPADSQFDDVLKKAGIEVTTNDANLLGNPEAEPPHEFGAGSPPEPELPLLEIPINPLDKYK